MKHIEILRGVGIAGVSVKPGQILSVAEKNGETEVAGATVKQIAISEAKYLTAIGKAKEINKPEAKPEPKQEAKKGK